MGVARSKTLRTISFLIVGIVFLTLAIRILYAIATGHPDETTTYARGLTWSRWSEFVTLVAILFVLAVAGAHKLWKRFFAAPEQRAEPEAQPFVPRGGAIDDVDHTFVVGSDRDGPRGEA